MAERPKSSDPIGSELVREDASFADIVIQFVEGLDGRLQRMTDALREGDYEALGTAAHKLKGSGGGFGYAILTECAAALETQAKAHQVDGCRSTIEELEQLVSRVVVDGDAD